MTHFSLYPFKNYNIDKYVFADLSIKQQLIEIANQRMADLDTLLFSSTEGNGGTLLMCSTLKMMVHGEYEFPMITGNHYRALAKMDIAAFMTLFQPYPFIVFDNIEYGCSEPAQYRWLKAAFRALRSVGKKTMATYTVMDEADFRVPDFIQESRHEVFYSLSNPALYPEIIRKQFANMEYAVSEQTINKLASDFSKCNVREAELRCIFYWVEENYPSLIKPKKQEG